MRESERQKMERDVSTMVKALPDDEFIDVVGDVLIAYVTHVDKVGDKQVAKERIEKEIEQLKNEVDRVN